MTEVNYPVEISVQDPAERAGLPSAIDPSLLAAKPPAATLARDRVFGIENLTAFYGDAPAIRDVSFEIYQRMVTAIIGPSGCGKSTFIRCLNRMNDVIPNFKTEGRILYHDVDLQARNIDPVGVRRRIGMVFQRPNPFPKSIYDNVAYGPRILGLKDDLDERVEQALDARRALGRGQGPAQAERLVALGRPAAAALHRPLPRDRARRDPDGRAGFGARPDRDDARSRT